MVNLARGLKAGLAAGVVYAVMIGLLHTGFFELCSSYQLPYIQSQLANLNTTTIITTGTKILTTTITLPSAAEIFNTDLIVFSLDWAIGALVLGVIYGVGYAFTYEKIPGLTSRRKGILFGIPVFVLGIILGVSGWEVGCSPDYYHVIPIIASFPASLAFGFLLGMFYDGFSAVEKEEKEFARQREENNTRIE
jgi:hypothetical protein